MLFSGLTFSPERQAGSERPDPSRTKTLMDLHIPEISSQLKRHFGFNAYNAKWIADYSNKVAPLLAAQKQLAFPLNQASRLTIATLKKICLCRTLAAPGKRASRSTNRCKRNRYRSDTHSGRHTSRFLLENSET